MKKILTIIILLIQLNVFAQEHQFNYRIKEDFSPANDVTAIRFDSKGDMWVATSFGLYKKEQNQWVLNGDENIYIQGFLIDKQDKKWVGLWAEGLRSSMDGKKWDVVQNEASSGSINSIAIDKNGEIWVGDFSNGVLQSDKGKWVNYKAGNVALGDNSVLSVLAGPQNNMWFGTYHGVSLFDGKSWKLYNKENSQLPDNNVYALLADKKGDIWMGTCKGLARLSANSWKVYNKGNSGLSSDLILSLGTDAKGNLWVGTNKGVNVFDGQRWKQISVENSNLIDNRIQAITSYGSATYVGTSKGIAVFK